MSSTPEETYRQSILLHVYALLCYSTQDCFLNELRTVRRQTNLTDKSTALHQTLLDPSDCLEDAFLSGVMTEKDRDEVLQRVAAFKTLMMLAAQKLFEAELAVTGNDTKLKKCRIALRDLISGVLAARNGGMKFKERVFDDIKLLLSPHNGDAHSLQVDRVAKLQNSFVKLRRQQQEWFANTDLTTGLTVVVKEQGATAVSEVEKPMTISAIRRARKQAKALEATASEMVAEGENVSPLAEVTLVSESYERPYVSFPSGRSGPAFLVSTDLL